MGSYGGHGGPFTKGVVEFDRLALAPNLVRDIFTFERTSWIPSRRSPFHGPNPAEGRHWNSGFPRQGRTHLVGMGDVTIADLNEYLCFSTYIFGFVKASVVASAKPGS